MSDALDAAGALATAGLVAGTIDSGKGSGAPGGHDAPGGGGTHGSPTHGACLNCGAALRGAYCEACGQAAHVHRSLLHLLEELLHGVFHFDAKGWRTLPLLVARPGVLTRRYIDGQRVRYVSPLALFLFTIFLMFFAASLGKSPPIGLDASNGAKAELLVDLAEARTEVAEAERKLADARRTGGDVADKTEDLVDARRELAMAELALKTVGTAASAIAPRPPAVATASSTASSVAGAASDADATVLSIGPSGVQRLGRHAYKPGVTIGLEEGYTKVRWLDQGIKHALANPELTIYKLKSSAYKYSFMLVPISLPFVWLLFLFRRGVTVYDHAIFVLYSLSFMSLLFVLLVGLGAAGTPATAIVAMALLVPPVHMGLQLRETYGLGLWATLWRTAALLVVASIVFMLFVSFIAYMVLA